MKIKKYAAIDIGSNAMRLLIANIVQENNKEYFYKSHLVRVPIRLGQDAFTVGEISERNILRMIKAMQAFRLLMQVYEVEKYAACATSAMREAFNGTDLVKRIGNEAAINIEIIDGKKEANIIANSDLKSLIQTDENFLYVDVGGGSTEFTVFEDGKQKASKSFKNGTVRLLNEMVTQNVWDEIERWIVENTQHLSNLQMIGSGGNINKVFKMSGKSNKIPLSAAYLKKQYKRLQSMTYEERITELELNTDRADVIVPALSIYVNAMKWSKASKIYVPKIGLSDGIIKAMHYQTSNIKIHTIE